jgi:hypothetical protein
MEEPISFWEYKERESNLILPEHGDNDKTLKDALSNVSVVYTSDVREGATFIYTTSDRNKFFKIVVSSKIAKAPHPKIFQNLM